MALRLLGWTLLLGLLSTAAVAAWAWWMVWGPLPSPAQDRQLEIRPGAGLGVVLRRLEADGVIRDRRPLLLYARFLRLDRQVPSGEILLTDCCESGAHLLRELVAGRPVLHAWTLIEGWTYAQAMRSLRAHRKVVPAMREMRDSCAAAKELSAGFCLEGMLRPDTYHFAAGVTDATLLRRALDSQRDLLTALWAQRQPGLPYESFYDAVRLASIVEKEASVAEERPAIAGVYVARLRRDMLLEADPTLLYNRPGGVQGGIRRSELRSETNPYNSYRFAGLPPTPISMPSQGALHAALHPDEEQGYLYFVAAATGSGRHLFSRTLAEHRRKARLQRRLRQEQRERRQSNRAALEEAAPDGPAAR